MWIRRSDKEYEDALALARRERLRRMIVAPPIIWIAMTLFFRFFGFGSRDDAVPSELDWPVAAGVAGALTLVSFLALTLFGGSSGDSNKRICTSCQVVRDARPGDLLLCECGGTFEPRDRWQWRDEHPP